MKKTLLVTILLISFNLIGQTDAEIIEIADKINNLDSISVQKFADNIAYSAKTDYKFYKVKAYKKSNVIQYRYIKTELTDEQLLDIKDFGCNENCLIVEFKIYYEGGNPDLEIKGVKKIAFSNVGSKRFLDLFPTWNREFSKEATKEEVVNFDNNHIYFGNKGMFRFQKFNNFWVINNHSLFYSIP